MPGLFNPNFNPAQVMMGGGGGNPPISKGPYVPTNPGKLPVGNPPRRIIPGSGGNNGINPTWGSNPPMSGPFGASPNSPSAGGNVLGSEAVRATGSGPYDNAYRQDLATYAGGQFQKPGGFLGLNPTGPITGNPTGGGNAPVQGSPTDLLSLAMGGQPFSFTPPTPKKKEGGMAPGWQDWLQQFRNQGNMMRGV